MKQNKLHITRSLKHRIKKLEQKPCCIELEKRVKAIELELENFKFRFSDFIVIIHTLIIHFRKGAHSNTD